MIMISQPVFVLYAISCAVLIVTLYGLAFFTAVKRARLKKVVNHEDVKVNSGAEVVEVEHADVARIKRAHLNAVENAVPFFVIGFLYTQTSPSLMTAEALFALFVGIRLFHAIFYLTATQPFRTASFAVGAVVNLFMVVQVLRAVV